MRDLIHHRGDVVRLVEASLEEGLKDVSRFPPGRCRRTRFRATVTRTTVRLDPALVARLEAAVRQVNTTRAALIEAMVEAKLTPPVPPTPPPAESPRALGSCSVFTWTSSSSDTSESGTSASRVT